MNKKGLLFVISGPAGTGKGTVVKHLLETGEFFFSVSATTRAPRDGEVHAINYYFITKEEFEKRIAAGEMLEYAQYVGNYYGTPKSAVEEALDAGKNVILEIETQGALQIRKIMPEAILILILAPDIETLEARLVGRGTESADIVAKRMAEARREVTLIDKYDYVVINEDGKSEEAAKDILGIAKAEKMRASRNTELKEKFI
ncbi:MAG: guanylate kinase [Ruminococcaceae bacterium]|nr:guanylate kinase [Oscillospiraceae bacterium]MBO5005983.1 guanylate kinase [Clostridia bacterium]